MMASDEGMVPKLEAALIAAKALPAPMFSTRFDPELLSENNPAEAFLRALRVQARARASEPDLRGGMAFEVDLHPIDADILPVAELLSRALERLRVPLAALRERFLERLENEPELEETTRQRLEGAARSLKRRAIDPLTAWRRILDALPGAGAKTPARGRPTSSFCASTGRPGPTATWRCSRICSTRRRPSSRPSPGPRTAC